MRYIAVVLVLVVAVTLGLFGIIHSRRTIEQQLSKTSYFEGVKHRVTIDVLKEYQSNIVEANMRLEQTKKKVAELLTNIKAAQESADGKKAELNTCTSEMSQIKAEIAANEAAKNKTDTEFHQNMANLKEQKNNLKIESTKRSKVCDYIIKTSVEGMKLCGIVPVLKAEKNPVAPVKA